MLLRGHRGEIEWKTFCICPWIFQKKELDLSLQGKFKDFRAMTAQFLRHAL